MLRVKLEADDPYTYRKILRGLDTSTYRLTLFGIEWNVQSLSVEAPFNVKCSISINNPVVTDKDIRDRIFHYRLENGRDPNYICCDEDMKKEIEEIYRSAYHIHSHADLDRCYGLGFKINSTITNFELV